MQLIIATESFAPVALRRIPGGYEAVLAHCKADYGIAGEGEAAFLALLKTLEGGHLPPKGLLPRRAAPQTQGWGRAWDDCPLRAHYAEA